MKKTFFIGRDKELQTLGAHWDRKEAQLLALMGRRRIGKSTLVQQFAEEADYFFEFQGIAPSKGINNDSQIKVVNEQINSYAKKKVVCTNWLEIFSNINNLIKAGKKLLSSLMKFHGWHNIILSLSEN